MNDKQKTSPEDMRLWLKAFILDRKIRHMSPGSINFYQQKLEVFIYWCEKEGETLTWIMSTVPGRS